MTNQDKKEYRQARSFRNLKVGDRVVQLNLCQKKVGLGFPWEIVKIWDHGLMAKIRYVGECGTLDLKSGYATKSAVSTRYLMKA